jgi:hypothetical protein
MNSAWVPMLLRLDDSAVYEVTGTYVSSHASYEEATAAQVSLEAKDGAEYRIEMRPPRWAPLTALN